MAIFIIHSLEIADLFVESGLSSSHKNLQSGARRAHSGVSTTTTFWKLHAATADCHNGLWRAACSESRICTLIKKQAEVTTPEEKR